MENNESHFRFLSPKELLNILTPDLSEERKNELAQAMEQGLDHQRSTKKRIVKTRREISKVWDISHVFTVAETECEYNRDGKLIHSKSYNYPLISDYCIDPDGEISSEIKYDDEEREIEKLVLNDQGIILKRTTYDEEGREKSITKKIGEGPEERKDFFYYNSDGYIMKNYRINGDDTEVTLRITDEKGTVYYEFDEEDYTCFRYQYDDLGRLIEVYSYEPNNIEGSGRYKCIEYQEENGETITTTSIYMMYPTDQSADFFDNSSLWEISDELREKKTKREKKETNRITIIEQDELTGDKQVTIESLDEDGDVFRRTLSFWVKDKRESYTVFLLDKSGNIIDRQNYDGNLISSHGINHYSEDGLILFSTDVFFSKLTPSQSKQMLSWYDYTFFEE